MFTVDFNKHTFYLSFLFSDADLERLFEEWEKDEEPLPVDELPEWDPRKPQVTTSKSQRSFMNNQFDTFIKASNRLEQNERFQGSRRIP